MKRLIDSLFRSQYRPLCIYAIHYIGNTDEAEDIVSACFAMLWERMAGGVKIENARAYLYSAVRNSCIDRLRKAQSETFLPRDLDGLISDDEARDRSGIEARLWDTIDKKHGLLIMPVYTLQDKRLWYIDFSPVAMGGLYRNN